jgi:hypothetical protein
MLCILQIGLLIFGIIMMITGKMKVSAGRVVEGTPARLIGFLALLPLPLCFAVGLIYGVYVGLNNPNPNNFNFGGAETWALTGIEAAITLGDLALVLIIGFVLGKPPLDKRKRLVEDWEDEDEDDDRPRRRKAAALDDEEDRPRRPSTPADDEDRRKGRFRE